MIMSDKNWEKGLQVFDAVYGPGTSEMVKPFKNSPFNQEIVGNQFANLWGNEAFSIREKRLMVLGATAMLGRQDLVEIQMTGALTNGEFTDEQLDLIPHFLLFYAGAGNTTALFRGIEAARAKVAEMKKDA
jgi:4-carboxymuconolactone decarboxylase